MEYQVPAALIVEVKQLQLVLTTEDAKLLGVNVGDVLIETKEAVQAHAHGQIIFVNLIAPKMLKITVYVGLKLK